mgnify:FL=1
MASLKRMLMGLLTSIGGMGTASIGGLPGPTKRREDFKAKWIDWGGSHRGIPKVMQSQQAHNDGAHRQAFGHLQKVRKDVERGRSPATPAFQAQLNNNLAVCAHECGEQAVSSLRRQRWQGIAKQCITRASEISTSSFEISETVSHNHQVISQT